jgi:hypothetical protein
MNWLRRRPAGESTRQLYPWQSLWVGKTYKVADESPNLGRDLEAKCRANDPASQRLNS